MFAESLLGSLRFILFSARIADRRFLLTGRRGYTFFTVVLNAFIWLSERGTGGRPLFDGRDCLRDRRDRRRAGAEAAGISPRSVLPSRDATLGTFLTAFITAREPVASTFLALRV